MAQLALFETGCLRSELAATEAEVHQLGQAERE